MALEDKTLPFKILKYSKTDLSSFNSTLGNTNSRTSNDVTEMNTTLDDINTRVLSDISTFDHHSIFDNLTPSLYSIEDPYGYNFMSETTPLGNINTFQNFFQQQENYGRSQDGYGQTIEYNVDWSKNAGELTDYYNTYSPLLEGLADQAVFRGSSGTDFTSIINKDWSLASGLGFLSNMKLQVSKFGVDASLMYIDSGNAGASFQITGNLNLFETAEKLTGKSIPQKTKNAVSVGASVGKFLGLKIPENPEEISFGLSYPIPFTGVRSYSQQVAENISGEGRFGGDGLLGKSLNFVGDITGVETAGSDKVFQTIATDSGYENNIEKWEHQTRGVIFQVYGAQNREGLTPDFRLQDQVTGHGLIIDWDLRNPIKSWDNFEFKLKTPDYIKAAGDWTAKGMKSAGEALGQFGTGITEIAKPLGQKFKLFNSKYVKEPMGDLFEWTADGVDWAIGGINDIYQDSAVDKFLTDVHKGFIGKTKGKLSLKSGQNDTALGFDFSESGMLTGIGFGMPATLIQSGIEMGSALGEGAVKIGKGAWDVTKEIAKGLNPIESFEIGDIALQSPLSFQVFNFGGNVKLRLIQPRSLQENRGKYIVQPGAIASEDSRVTSAAADKTTPYADFRKLANNPKRWYGHHASSYYPHKTRETNAGDQFINSEMKTEKKSYDAGNGNLLESAAQGMPFYFRDMRDGTYVALRANINSLNENVQPDWNETNYIGRSEPVYTYLRSKRNIGFNLKLYAQTALELESIYTKLRRLTSMCYPMYLADYTYSEGQLGELRMRPPFVKFRLGELYGNSSMEQIVKMDSVTYTVPDESTWEWRRGKRVPKYVEAAIALTVIHRKAPRISTAFYGYVPGKPASTTFDIGGGGSTEHPATHALGDIERLGGM